MKERPILYSGPMVLARNAGVKRMTRRIVKLPPWVPDQDVAIFYLREQCKAGKHASIALFEDGRPIKRFICPFGGAGDRLWGRETYALLVDPGALTTWDLQIPAMLPTPQNTELGHIPTPIYRVDGERLDVRSGNGGNMRWRPGIHMPRWASRMLDEITEVRIERLQDISEDDAKAEGFRCLTKDGGITYKYGIADADGWPGTDNTGWPWSDWEVDPRKAFRRLWIHINGTESWDANPFVWVISFKTVSS